MNITIYPTPIAGTFNAPSTKSITHRAIICASLANSNSEIHHPLMCDDTINTIKAMELLGVKIIYKNECLFINPPKKFSKINEPITCEDSGATLRFLIPIITHLQKSATFEGSKRLIERICDNDLSEINLKFMKTINTIHILPSELPNVISMNDTNSTQLISGMLLMSPLCTTDTLLTINSGIIDPYIETTLTVMKNFGINYHLVPNDYDTSKQTILIKKDNCYQGAIVDIEGDYSSAANMLVMGALGEKVIVKNLYRESIQGDASIIDILQKMHAKIDIGENIVTIYKSTLTPYNLSLQYVPDLGPLLIGLAAVINGKTIFSGLNRLIRKESNRLDATIHVLKLLGADITLKDNLLEINGTGTLNGGIKVDSFADHRIVFMICAISSHFDQPVTIINAEAITKSYPDFFNDFRKLGGHFIEEVNHE